MPNVLLPLADSGDSMLLHIQDLPEPFSRRVPLVKPGRRGLVRSRSSATF